MSYILDALKKSESERRLGDVPGLSSRQPHRSESPNRRYWLALLLLATGMTVAVGGSWWWLNSDRASSQPPGTAASSVQPGAAPVTSVENANSEGDRLAASSNSIVAATDPQLEALEQQLPRPQPKPGPAPGSSLPEPVSEAAVEPAPTLDPEPIPNAVDGPTAGAAAAQPLRDEAELDPAGHLLGTDEPIPGESADRNARTAKPLPRPVVVNLPAYPAIPDGWHQEVGELVVSMHVFATEPEDRFALVNGRRLAAGDSLSDQWQVAEITARGLVLKSGQRKFLLQARGK